jgi:hypothetical protein
MNTKVFAVDGRGFDGGVVDAIPRPAAAAAAKQRELIDEFMAMLCRLDPNTPELQHHRDVLIGKRLALNKECLKLIEAERIKANAALRAEWEEQKAACRKQQAIIDALNAELVEVNREWNTASERKSKAGMHVFNAQERRKNIDRFAAADKIAKADAAVKKAEQEFEESGQPEAQWRARRNDLVLVQIPAQKKKLDEFAAREMELRAAITGESYTSDLGIIVPARAPLA